MSLLDDARRMMEIGADTADYYGDACQFCDGRAYSSEEFAHQSDCPWMSMPKIIAALEAAERLIDCGGQNDDREWLALAEALQA